MGDTMQEGMALPTSAPKAEKLIDKIAMVNNDFKNGCMFIGQALNIIKGQIKQLTIKQRPTINFAVRIRAV